ncbi:hypothetical protein JZ751_008237, partial [Albula glossodonta]
MEGTEEDIAVVGIGCSFPGAMATALTALNVGNFWNLHAGQPVPVTGLPPSIQSQKGTEERDVVEVAEEDRRAGVHTERLHGAERRHEADVESQDVGQGGDGDGDGRLS